MWKVIVDEESKSEARKQLSFLYGHLSAGETKAMDQFFDNFFEKWTKGEYSDFHNLRKLISIKHKPRRFEEVGRICFETFLKSSEGSVIELNPPNFILKIIIPTTILKCLLFLVEISRV